MLFIIHMQKSNSLLFYIFVHLFMVTEKEGLFFSFTSKNNEEKEKYIKNKTLIAIHICFYM